MAKAKIIPKKAVAKAKAVVALKPSNPPRRSATHTQDRLIEEAIRIAVECHRGQIDKYDQPYILHVLGVAGRCRTNEQKIVAFLHDVVEDGHITFEELRERGFGEEVLSAVERLTRRKGESYTAFVDRIAPDPLARIVKLADLEDNMDIRRSNREMKQRDSERMEKYRVAWQKLSEMK